MLSVFCRRSSVVGRLEPCLDGMPVQFYWQRSPAQQAHPSPLSSSLSLSYIFTIIYIFTSIHFLSPSYINFHKILILGNGDLPPPSKLTKAINCTFTVLYSQPLKMANFSLCLWGFLIVMFGSSARRHAVGGLSVNRASAARARKFFIRHFQSLFLKCISPII